MRDIIAEEGAVLLGSRLKRLAERLQAGAEQIALSAGVTVQPSQLALMNAIERCGPLSIGSAAQVLGISQPAVTRMASQLEDRGLLEVTATPGDKRSRMLALAAAGMAELQTARTLVWPRARAAVGELCDVTALLAQVAAAEAALDAAPLERRPGGGLKICAFSDALAPEFDRINREWITAMYTLEAVDLEQLENPRRAILDGGGDILFVSQPGAGVVGAGALLRTAPREFELIKMGVTEPARGRKAGEFLLAALIERAFALGCDNLFLLTNRKSQAAIHLYEKLGFRHDAEIMARHGGEYSRCDVAMRYCGPLAA